MLLVGEAHVADGEGDGDACFGEGVQQGGGKSITNSVVLIGVTPSADVQVE